MKRYALALLTAALSAAGCSSSGLDMGVSNAPHSTNGYSNETRESLYGSSRVSSNTGTVRSDVSPGGPTQVSGRYQSNVNQGNAPDATAYGQANPPAIHSRTTRDTSGQYSSSQQPVQGTVSDQGGQVRGQYNPPPPSDRTYEQANTDQMQDRRPMANEPRDRMKEGQPVGQMANLSDADRRFFQDAASAGLFEIKSSQLIVDKSGNNELKQIAQHIIDDHKKVNDQLKGWARQYNMDLPSQLNTRDQAAYDSIAKLNGADLDQAYTWSQVAAHEEAIQKFQQQSNNGQNGDLKQLAQQSVPVLQNHLDSLRSLGNRFATER